jgi:leucyl aminopeptidase (aminopeptidase T)
MVKKMQKINGRYSISEERMHENVVKVEQSEALLEANRVALGNILRGHFYFYNILEDERVEIIKKMQLCSGQPGTYIFKQGDPASAFFIIH